MQGVIAELHVGVRDFVPTVATARRLARNSLPFAAAAVAGAGMLSMRKQREPPATEFIAQRSSFTCLPRSAWGPGLSAKAVADTLREAGAVDMEALRRSVSRMRGPLERDIMAVEAEVDRGGATLRQGLYADLVEKWRSMGYFKEPLEHIKPRHAFMGLDHVTREDLSYGHDIGCEVPVCMLRADDEDMNGLSPPTWAAASEALDQHGVVMLRGLMSPAQVTALRQRLNIQVSAMDRRRAGSESNPLVREYDPTPLYQEDADLDPPLTSTSGRLHFNIRKRLLGSAVRDASSGAMPLVWQHFCPTDAGELENQHRKPYVSEVQLIVTEPCAIDQFWHLDNAARGLTLFIPLTPVPEDIGPTHFLPGSHHLFSDVSYWRRLQRFMDSFLSSNGVAVGTMAAGDALVYDSRIIHKGSANRKYDRIRVALVYRYDIQRPPGQDMMQTQFASWIGNIGAALQQGYTAVPGPAESAPAS